MAAVGKAVRLGLELQEAGRKAAAGVERSVRKEVRRHALAEPFARAWLRAVRRGGPRRAAALLARGGRLPSDRRLARPSRSANSRARAVACGRKLTAREPAGLRGRVRRRGARFHAAAHATCALAALRARVIASDWARPVDHRAVLT